MTGLRRVGVAVAACILGGRRLAREQLGWRETVSLGLRGKRAVRVLGWVVGAGGWRGVRVRLLCRDGGVVGGRGELLRVFIRGLWPMMCGR